MSTAAPSPSAPVSSTEQEKGLARTAQRLASWTERWFPDAYVFALAGVAFVALLAFINGSSPKAVVGAFGDGFWDLARFTLQMAMVVLTGYVVATAPIVKRLIDRLAAIPKTPAGAIAFVCAVGMLVSLLNWGLSLVFGGLLARAVARRTDLEVDYRALGAAAYMGLGGVWALGISSSAAQLQATPSSLPPALLKITGVLDYSKTIFTWQSMTICAVLILVSVVICYYSAPRGAAVRTAQDLKISLDDEPAEAGRPTRPGEFLEFHWILPALMGLMTLGWVVWALMGKGFIAVISSLNAYLMVFLVLGLVLHGTPRAFLNAVSKAVPTTAGILVQYPLYAAMAAMISTVPGRGGHTIAEHLAHFFTGIGGNGWFAVVIAIYTALLGLLVPSGGGKWLVEAPYVMQASTDVGMNLGWTVQIYNIAEALPNLVNPFFMLPLLAVLGLKARDLVGYTFLQFLIHLPIVLLGVWLLGMTFTYEPPIIPPTK